MTKKFVIMGSMSLIGVIITAGLIFTVAENFKNKIQKNNQNFIELLNSKEATKSKQINLPTFKKGETTIYKQDGAEYKIYTPNDNEYVIDRNGDLIGLNQACLNAHPTEYFNLEIPKNGVEGLSLDKEKNPTFTFLDRVVRVDLTKSNCFKINFVRKLSKIKEIVFSNKIVKLTENGIIQNPKLDTLTFLNLIDVPRIPKSAFRKIAIKKLNNMADNLNIIDRLAFSDNVHLKMVDLSNTKLTQISEFAFRTTGVEHFYAPDSLQIVGNGILDNVRKDDLNNVVGRTKGTNRYQVNFPKNLNTAEQFSKMGIVKKDGSVYKPNDPLPIEELRLNFNGAEIYKFVKRYANLSSDNLKIKFDLLPFSEKVKMVDVSLPSWSAITSFDVIRKINSIIDPVTQDLSIEVELNSLYVTNDNKSTVIKYVNGKPTPPIPEPPIDNDNSSQDPNGPPESNTGPIPTPDPIPPPPPEPTPEPNGNNNLSVNNKMSMGFIMTIISAAIMGVMLLLFTCSIFYTLTKK